MTEREKQTWWGLATLAALFWWLRATPDGPAVVTSTDPNVDVDVLLTTDAGQRVLSMSNDELTMYVNLGVITPMQSGWIQTTRDGLPGPINQNDLEDAIRAIIGFNNI